MFSWQIWIIRSDRTGEVIFSQHKSLKLARITKKHIKPKFKGCSVYIKLSKTWNLDNKHWININNNKFEVADKSTIKEILHLY